MRLVRHLSDLPFKQLAAGSVVSIGAFDGLHLGHCALLERVLLTAREKGVPAVVMSFEPTPKEFFATEKPPARLMRFREKYRQLAAMGVDLFFCPRFSAAMRDIDAADFIRQILLHGLNASHVVIGGDFRFAKQRMGDATMLQQYAGVLGYDVEDMPSVFIAGVRASSTAIRDALASGQLPLAAALLGRPYRMSGKIVRGRQVGRTLGYATANVDLRRRQSAVMGIYAVRISGLAEGIIDGVASVGTRPTFDLCKPLLEVHLFDFDRDIYGQNIDVDFVEFIRGEEKFDSVDELVAQMRKDEDNARAILND